MGNSRTTVARYLIEHGPTRRSDIPESVHSGSETRRRAGVRLLQINRVSNTRPSGKWVSVLYLPDHDPETVVREFLDANPSMLETSTGAITRYFGKVDPSFREAWQAISQEYETSSRAGGNVGQYQGTECPLCGADLDVTLPKHLPECTS